MAKVVTMMLMPSSVAINLIHGAQRLVRQQINGGTSIFRISSDFMKGKIERINTPLQLDEDIDLHVTGWVIQRIGWGAMFVFLCLAALGLFGDGFLSNKTVAVDGATVSYERFLRRENDAVIEIMAAAANGNIELTLGPDFNRTYEIESVFPEPAERFIRNNSTVFVFPATGQGQITFFLNIRKETVGRVRTSLRVNRSDFTLSHYVFP